MSLDFALDFKLSLGEFKKLEIECIMSGFEGDESSQPKWTTYFEDWQISNKGQEPVIQNEYARWKIYVNVTNIDAGIQVKLSTYLYVHLYTLNLISETFMQLPTRVFCKSD